MAKAKYQMVLMPLPASKCAIALTPEIPVSVPQQPACSKALLELALEAPPYEEYEVLRGTTFMIMKLRTPLNKSPNRGKCLESRQ